MFRSFLMLCSYVGQEAFADCQGGLCEAFAPKYRPGRNLEACSAPFWVGPDSVQALNWGLQLAQMLLRGRTVREAGGRAPFGLMGTRDAITRKSKDSLILAQA
jgi:hypothetical protein